MDYIIDQEEILELLREENLFFYLWQETNKKSIYIAQVAKLDQSVVFRNSEDNDFKLNPDEEVFCFIESYFYLCKLQLQESILKEIEVIIPAKVAKLDEVSGQKLADGLFEILKKERISKRENIISEVISSYSLLEEDNFFRDQRKEPRSRPKQGKIVHITIAEALEHYDMYDLSQGGLSIVTPNINLFNEMDRVQIDGFDGKYLEEPIIAEVKNVRDIDGDLGYYKIGLQFVE